MSLGSKIARASQPTMFLETRPANKMDRLIPLFLKSASQRDPMPPPRDPPRAESPTLPLPQKSKRRPRPRPASDLTIIPFTIGEWIKVMEQVKALYYRKHYKQCSAKCKQILETIRDPYRVHPLYSIYLCFFAASSLELTARSLHKNSSLKLPLFQESLTYYKKAQSYMEFAAFATNPDIIHATSRNQHKTNSSISSSIRSSVDSVFSQTSTSSVASSILDSPTSSSHSDAENGLSILKPMPLRPKKKKVAFNLTSLPSLPDSQDGGMTADDLLASFPSPPCNDMISPTIISTNSDALAIYDPPHSPQSQSQSQSQSLTTTQSITSYYTSQTTPPRSPPSFANKERSLTRYRAHLSSLKEQLEYHSFSLTAQIHTLQIVRRARRSNLPDLFVTPPAYSSRGRSSSTSSTVSATLTNPLPSLTSSPTTSTGQAPTITFNPTATLGHGISTPGEESPAHRLPDIRERIQRLREDGWARSRFNARKYQALCQKAIQELDDEGWRSPSSYDQHGSSKKTF